ncbi:FAD-binding oxidoreductase [Burkholderia multivorans]|uniref:FAD-binding oxidoreductase n=1 Tax=Burkholderia multivorans TaxID=87883 RepID=UPI00201888D5|nr:FAD-binding oxidoreductase [Burkholderia multivorans]MCO1367044.1 FAD-binding oxidoreductase [Burkholderia multivorans]MCO1376653.1 FAD-binding oxidoreductase [Burkholderia multivorans]UQP18605.1 FAD-binding oxidoreductase [Burkholderia multivorans]UQP86574.1 FAD-binding oxidoreductase [Burkholderia multivorans]
MTTFVVKFEPSNVELPSDGESTVLDTALAAGFFPKHSCRRGECRACETRIVSGEVRYAAGAEPEGLKLGHCLTCLAVPATNVVLDAPEVAEKPGRRIVKTGARVTAVERVSGDVTILRLQLPAGSGFEFDAGQYVDVVLRDGTRRSYSMANAPSGSGEIELHIRAMPGGRFSQHVFQNLKQRDLLRIEGPFGSFTLRDTNAPVILLASGTGYAPIASMMRACGDQLSKRGATFYWGGRRKEDLYAMNEALAWAKSAPGLEFVPVLSDPDPAWQGRTGFVHEAVQRDHPDLSEFEVYACGNPLMIDAARHTFRTECGLFAESFFSDSFVTAVVQ